MRAFHRLLVKLLEFLGLSRYFWARKMWRIVAPSVNLTNPPLSIAKEELARKHLLDSIPKHACEIDMPLTHLECSKWSHVLNHTWSLEPESRDNSKSIGHKKNTSYSRLKGFVLIEPNSYWFTKERHDSSHASSYIGWICHRWNFLPTTTRDLVSHGSRNQAKDKNSSALCGI